MHLYPSSRVLLLAFPPPSVGSLLTPYYFPSLHHDSTVSVPSLPSTLLPRSSVSRFGFPRAPPLFPLGRFAFSGCTPSASELPTRAISALPPLCAEHVCPTVFIFPPANSIQSTPEFVSSSLCRRFPDSSVASVRDVKRRSNGESSEVG